MKNIKPGRGPSALGAFGGIIVALFGVFWTFFSVSIGAPAIFPLFGVLFIILAIGGAVYNFKNATGSNRMSIYDITDENEEPDPLQTRFHKSVNEVNAYRPSEDDQPGTASVNFCPYCRCELKSNYKFCPKCGKDLSEIK